ncbi:MAG: protein-L-isoaspartate(D-aspartate) O-methyltransferase [Campylobacteraceae bacterium]|nr:protein-L-isoaspartate(D-aspartate) O-methyltransferase [Campylobacteraceae bacterium]
MSRADNFASKMKLEKSKKMATEIRQKCQISDEVFNDIATSERESLVQIGFGLHAYKQDAQPLVANQWISSPLTVAKMSEALKCKDADSVLEIGCGSGYQALILSKLIRRVFSIERIERLAKEAKEKFKQLGIHNINVRFDDGQNGWRDFAPFERILFSASIKEVPKKIFEQLKVGGILIAPIEKNGRQIITSFTKTDKSIERTELEECLFVPIINGKTQ